MIIGKLKEINRNRIRTSESQRRRDALLSDPLSGWTKERERERRIKIKREDQKTKNS